MTVEPRPRKSTPRAIVEHTAEAAVSVVPFACPAHRGGEHHGERTAPPNISAGARSTMLEAALPEFAGRRDRYELLFGDINGAALVDGALGGMQTGDSLLAPITTDLGKRFLGFIAEPEQ